MQNDNLTICDRCGSDACYKQPMTEDINLFFCYGCGFQSNSAMVEGDDFYNEQIEILPELYKDLISIDDNSKIWIPSAINLPTQGMIFINGTSLENWKWSAVKAVPVTEEEKEKYPIPGKKGEFYEWRMDMSTMMSFGEKDFMEALSYIGILPENN